MLRKSPHPLSVFAYCRFAEKTALVVLLLSGTIRPRCQARRSSSEGAWQGWVQESCLESLKGLEFHLILAEALLRPCLLGKSWLELVPFPAEVHLPAELV